MGALRIFKSKIKYWRCHIHEVLKHRHIDTVKQVLRDYAQMRSISIYVTQFKKNVIRCQRIIRAFLAAKRRRQKELSKQWDMIVRDIMGDDSGRQWMFRLLNQAKLQKTDNDAHGKAVTPSDDNGNLPNFKDERILDEVRKMRRRFLHEWDQYKTNLQVFKAKVEMLGAMSSMGLDPALLRSKLGIASMVPKPKMETIAPRAVVRHSVEQVPFPQP